MNTTLSQEPYKMPAGILAVAVHGAFFFLLYFGFSWQSHQPAAMHVDLWRTLPDEVVAPSAPQPRVEASAKPAQAEKAIAPDISLPDKKKPVEKAETRPDKKQVEDKTVVQKPVEQKPVEKTVAPPVQDQQADAKKAEKDAETARIVDEYRAKIQDKIQRNVVMPPVVAKDARAEFLVTLLPGGSVLRVELKKSSGNRLYDDAVERAILKSDPLPLPADVALFNRFRELDLVFRPTE